LLNNQVNAAITGAFLVLVALVLAANARVWWQVLVGRKAPLLHEDPYVALASARS
jgi:carbon starvation protein